ncbi:PIN domain nuclease [Nocardioides rotundus]|uniref:type II toxin-antitoxin system VapC family toxin n=1 Tax=Nocardioides rotundus TaxID=1774216 RepID=UPI001CBCFEC1|nr:PIN domain nuclease [Nocardioides rotundus]UAL31450.1 PIN domain nuclease [Nocardioides rotundus]
MIVDTSVWIDFLRPGSSAAGDRLEEMVTTGDRIVVPETVLMELLSGPTDEIVAAQRQRMLEAFYLEPVVPLADSVRAASLQRSCRRGGDTVRNLGDCLIAATALRLDLPVVHRDRDFEVLARHSDLRTESLLDA